MRQERARKERASDNAKKAFAEIASSVGFGSTANTNKEDALVEEISLNIFEESTAMDSTLDGNKPSRLNKAKTISVISSDMKIEGNITTTGDLEIAGLVTGNVASGGNIWVTGTLNGNINSECVIVRGGVVTSDTIYAKKEVVFEKHSEIKGNIQCDTITIDSSVTGNIIASDNCQINSTAVVKGDIQACYISVQKGASLSGTCEVVKNA